MLVMRNLKDLVNVLREDLASHNGDWTRPGFHTLAVHRLGTYVHSWPRSVVRKPFVAAYRVGYVFCRNFYGIELPYSVRVGRRLTIEHQGGIVVHGQARIGDDCTIRQGVTLGMKNADRAHEAPILEDGVSVGAGACVLGKVRVGKGAQIGANSVVTRNVPEGQIAVGIPAVCRPNLLRGTPVND